MQKVVITGGAGFIGSHFLELWRAKHPEDQILVLDKLGVGSDEEFLKRNLFPYECLDLADFDAVHRTFTKFKPDLVVHLAAESHVDRSITSPRPFVESNIIGTFNLLETVRGSGIRFHHVSTDEVYGDLPDEHAPAFTEENQYRPSSVYSASKASSDMLVHAYVRTYGLNATISNCSNNFGPRQADEKLIPKVIGNILAGREIPVYGMGANIRDWIFVKDHCEGLYQVIKGGRAGQLYNIGGNKELSNLDMIALISDELLSDHWQNYLRDQGRTMRDPKIKFVEDRKGHDFRYAIDSTKMAKEFGWEPSLSAFSSNLRETVKFYVERYLEGEK